MPSLYELKEEYLAMLDAMDSEDIDNEEAYKLLQQVRGDIKDKAINIGYAIKNLSSDADAIDAEIKRLQNRKKSVVNKEARLKDFLLYIINDLNIKGFKDPVMPISKRKNSKPTVHISDMNLLPSKYIIETIQVKIDKDAIIRDSKETEVEGVQIITGEHIRIG